MPGSFNETTCKLLVSGTVDEVSEESSGVVGLLGGVVPAGGVVAFGAGPQPTATTNIAIATNANIKRMTNLLKVKKKWKNST
jgi:hypothetical protein